MRYKTVRLPETVGEEIRRLIDERREFGYVSLKGLLEDAIRSRLDVIRGGRLAGTEARGTKMVGHAVRDVGCPTCGEKPLLRRIDDLDIEEYRARCQDPSWTGVVRELG